MLDQVRYHLAQLQYRLAKVGRGGRIPLALEQCVEQRFAGQLAPLVVRDEREQFDALVQPGIDLLALDRHDDAAELGQLHRAAQHFGQRDTADQERAPQFMPRRVVGRLEVEAASDDVREVGEGGQQVVVGPLQRGHVQGELRRAVGSRLVPTPPFRLGQVDRGRRQVEQPLPCLHSDHRPAQLDDRTLRVVLHQAREPCQHQPLLDEEGIRPAHGMGGELVEDRQGGVGIGVGTRVRVPPRSAGCTSRTSASRCAGSAAVRRAAVARPRHGRRSRTSTGGRGRLSATRSGPTNPPAGGRARRPAPSDRRSGMRSPATTRSPSPPTANSAPS